MVAPKIIVLGLTPATAAEHVCCTLDCYAAEALIEIRASQACWGPYSAWFFYYDTLANSRGHAMQTSRNGSFSKRAVFREHREGLQEDYGGSLSAVI